MRHSRIQQRALLALSRCAALGALSLALVVSTPARARAQAGEPAQVFLRGDSNADGWVSMADAIMTSRYLFSGRRPPPCLDAADADDNEILQLSDPLVTLANFFPNNRADWGTVMIPAPYPDPGADLTPHPPEPFDVSEALGCAAYEVRPAESTQDLIRIGAVEASPGEEVSVPVFLTNSVEVEAIQLVIQYDPSEFTPHSGGIDWGEAFDLAGTFYEFLEHLARGVNPMAVVHAHPEDGLITIGIVGNVWWGDGMEVPPGNDTLLFRFKGTVSPNAQPGTSILLEPTNGPDGQGVKPPLRMRNELTHLGESRLATTLPRTAGGLIGIVDDVTFFVRGDANGDAAVNISDPIFTLSYLFSGGGAPACQDAADADDNGTLELSDAVITLGFLFNGGTALPSPLSVPGGDPTPDALPGCRL